MKWNESENLSRPFNCFKNINQQKGRLYVCMPFISPLVFLQRFIKVQRSPIYARDPLTHKSTNSVFAPCLSMLPT